MTVILYIRGVRRTGIEIKVQPELKNIIVVYAPTTVTS